MAESVEAQAGCNLALRDEPSDQPKKAALKSILGERSSACADDNDRAPSRRRIEDGLKSGVDRHPKRFAGFTLAYFECMSIITGPGDPQHVGLTQTHVGANRNGDLKLRGRPAQNGFEF